MTPRARRRSDLQTYLAVYNTQYLRHLKISSPEEVLFFSLDHFSISTCSCFIECSGNLNRYEIMVKYIKIKYELIALI